MRTRENAATSRSGAGMIDVLLWVGLVFGVHLLIRNQFVYWFCKNMARRGRQCPYHLMMLKFWVWPLSRFVNERLEEDE